MLDKLVNNDLGFHNLVVEGVDADLVAWVARMAVAFVETKGAHWTKIFANVTLEHVVGDVEGIAKDVKPEEIHMGGAAAVACGEKRLFGMGASTIRRGPNVTL